MSHPQICEFTHTKPSRAGEALNLIPSLPVPIEDEETQYTRDPYGKRLGHPLAKFPERRRGNESSMSLRSADVSGAGSALRHFLLDGAPKLRIDVAEDGGGRRSFKIGLAKAEILQVGHWPAGQVFGVRQPVEKVLRHRRIGVERVPIFLRVGDHDHHGNSNLENKW